MSRGIIWQWGVPRTIQGYWDMGRITIPPRPLYTVLTDRNDGTLWLLSYNNQPPNQASDGLGYISINTVIPNTPDKIIYGPYDGPYVKGAQGRLRLFVRGGRLGMDLVPKPSQGVTYADDGRVLARTPQSTDYHEIVIPVAWQEFARFGPEMIGWVDAPTPPQTPNPV